MPRVAISPIGASGIDIGFTAAETIDASLVPTSFVATTETVYSEPFSRLEIQQVNVPTVQTHVHERPPGLAVATYEVMTELPFVRGATQETLIVLSAPVTLTLLGGDGRAKPVLTGPVAPDHEPNPCMF